MLAELDNLIGVWTDDTTALNRPHQLFLTGDQIYADDVNETLLEHLIEASETLLGWPEPLFGTGLDDELEPEALEPGERQNTASDKAKFTSDEADNHLFRLGEFYAMYIFAWSDLLWPTDMSGFDQHTQTFQATLPQVRRALANIPVYMMCDDHEITDDWGLHLQWCVSVFGAELGKRVMQNGLIAFALCQAWGNTPERFQSNDPTQPSPGSQLLNLVERWRARVKDIDADAAEQRDIERQLRRHLGIPNNTSELNALKTERVLPDFPEKIFWSYTVQGNNYQTLVLDTRTWRAFPPLNQAYPANKINAPALLSLAGFSKQFAEISADKELTFVISPPPVIMVPWIAWIKNHYFVSSEKGDQEDWELQAETVQQLLAKLAEQQRVVFLCGDVHHGFTSRIRYTQAAKDAVFANFTSSPLKNQDKLTRGYFDSYFGAHQIGYHLWGAKLPDPEIRRRLLPGGDLDWCYRIDFIMMNPLTEPSQALPAPTSGDTSAAALSKTTEIARVHTAYSDQWADGKEIVGRNHIGQISLQWSEVNKQASQTLHWKSPKDDPLTTTYNVSLELDPLDCSQTD